MTCSNGPNSLSARDRAALLHPMTDLVRHAEEGPLTIVRGEGIRVEDEEGRSYIEAVSGLWSIALGFGQKRLAEAAYQQLLELPSYHLFRHKSHPRAIELGERLLALAPAPMSKIFFANSGSEANETAVKLAWYYNNALNRASCGAGRLPPACAPSSSRQRLAAATSIMITAATSKRPTTPSLPPGKSPSPRKYRVM